MVEANIEKVFLCSDIGEKQHLINHIRNSAYSFEDATLEIMQLSSIPYDKRDIFYYVAEFLLKFKQFNNGHSKELAFYALKLEVIRLATNRLLETSEESYCAYDFDTLICTDFSSQLEEEKSNLTTDKENFSCSIFDLENLPAEIMGSEQQTYDDTSDLKYPFYEIIGVERDNILMPKGVISHNCMVEDAFSKEHRVLIIYKKNAGNNRCRVIGYDLNLRSLVRFTHQLFDENVQLKLTNGFTSLSRLGVVKERSVIDVTGRKIMHERHCDLFLIDDQSVNVLDPLSKNEYGKLLSHIAGKDNPNELWQAFEKHYEAARHDNHISRVASNLTKKRMGIRDTHLKRLYLVRVKSSRLEWDGEKWFCSMFRKEVSTYKPRIFDDTATSQLDRNMHHTFKGVALVEFGDPPSGKTNPIINALKLWGEIKTYSADGKTVKTGDSNYLAKENEWSEEEASSDLHDSNDDQFSGFDEYASELARELQDSHGFAEDDYGDESFPDAQESDEDSDYDETYYLEMAYELLEEENEEELQCIAEYRKVDCLQKSSIAEVYETANAFCKILWQN